MPASLKFRASYRLVRKAEGGNDDDKRDRGGRTSRGITQSEFNDWLAKHHQPKKDVWKATEDEIFAIYCAEYWDSVRGDDLPLPVGYLMFDAGVLSGVGHSRKLAQRVVGVRQDGQLGPISIAALNAVDKATFINRFCDLRVEYLKSRPTFDTFGEGWLNRQSAVREDALAMLKLPG